MVIGAFLGVLGLYIMDILLNLAYGAKKWYGQRSSIVDFISAAVSGAISMISVKKLSTVISASVSGITYVLNQWTNGQSVSLYTLIGTIGIAIVMDLILPGDGIDLSNRVGIIKTSKQKLKTLVSSRKISMYKDKISSNKSLIIKNAFSTLLSNIMSRAADESRRLNRTKKLFNKFRSVIRI